ncbi:MAG: hypothetical protein R3B96_08155 [Pirellulaceae bacterium]
MRDRRSAFEQGWVEPVMPQSRTGKKLAAVVGSGPRAWRRRALNEAGHR